MRPSPNPTIADLYLAFRQAKTALYFERRGVGLLELAAFEQDLPNNLRTLERVLAQQSWFDELPLGETWLVPKRLRVAQDDVDEVVRIGAPRRRYPGRSVDVQTRLSPHPAFAIVEVLYLWRFGGLVDSLLSRQEVLGYRLDLREQRVVPHRRWLFEYWPVRYQQFRTAPLSVAKNALSQGKEVLIVSGDFANYYDTVAPSFLLSEAFVDELQALGAEQFDPAEYRHATMSLLGAYDRCRAVASRRLEAAIDTGVPIGALTSRLVANVALAPFDRHISAHPDVHCYRRYVDDFVIVAKAGSEKRGLVDVLQKFLPLLDDGENVLRLDVGALGRAGSDFQLQKAKIRVHHLAGVPGMDFVDAVASDFGKAVSERRAFIDSATFVGDGVTHLVRAGESEGSPLRVLRDADRARLERFALSTSLQSLERVSSLIDHEQARQLVRGSLDRVGRVLDSEDNWVDDLDVSLRLLKLAISAGDGESAQELNVRLDRVWGSIAALRSATSTLYYCGREIDGGGTRPWTWLRNYLHALRIEAVVSSLRLGMTTQQVESLLPGGLQLRIARIGSLGLLRRAALLASADLRSRDREDDFQLSGPATTDYEWLRGDLNEDDDLRARLSAIDEFVRRCEALRDHAWLLPPARLFLCTRPPSYFDIARRWLYRVEKDGFAADVFERLLSTVNAVRGTEYRDPVGAVIDRNTVSIESFWADEPDRVSTPVDPRIILGNLVVDEVAWDAAATRVPTGPFGKPVLTPSRLHGIARVLEKATRVSQGRSSAVLVLPELSVPRRWFRAVSNHVVRVGRFGLVVGLEYLHDPVQPYVSNQVFAVLPGPFSSVATWPWTKRLPAHEEGLRLSRLPSPVSFPPGPTSGFPRTVIKSPWGSLSVLICSELIEARRVADLLGRVDVVLCPAWNQDTSSYDHLIQSVGFQLHSIIAIANNGRYSDCRAWAPRTERWERDLCRLIERDVDDVVHVDIPLASLLAFHTRKGGVKEWRPLPPDWP